MKAELVTHFIAGYPDADASLEVGRGLAEGGASYLEMQIPFSDPSADGPVIENASRIALEQSYKVEQALKMMETLNRELNIPVFLMSYGNILFARGLENMVKSAREAGAAGLIIPDLVYGRDEGLYEMGKKQGVPVLPVITPSVAPERLKELLSLNPEWIYTALRSGITGAETKLDETNLSLLDTLKPSKTKVMAGFGIKSPEQVKTLTPHCDAVVVGSAIVRAVAEARKAGESVRQAACDTVRTLLS